MFELTKSLSISAIIVDHFTVLHGVRVMVQVGWNLKSPVYPIWVLGSESHLTVLFSQVCIIV